MLDIGWSEILLIAVVAIVVIGPKDLPDALRTLGRMLTKVRRMAGEFQGQFNQAIREANLEDVKRDFDELRQSTSLITGGINPVSAARKELKGLIAGTAVAAATSSTPMIDASQTSSAPVAAPPISPEADAARQDEAEPEPIPSAFATSPSFRRPS